VQRLRFLAARKSTWATDTALALYGDLGSGTVDFDHPLPPGFVAMWPATPGSAGHLQAGHLQTTHLSGVGPDGHLDGIHLRHPHLAPMMPLVVASPSYVFGRFRHVIRTFDSAGNTLASGAFEDVRTINAAPAAVDGVRRVTPCAGGSVRFVFVPVRFHALAGS
jgi:hypothetical protein